MALRNPSKTRTEMVASGITSTVSTKPVLWKTIVSIIIGICVWLSMFCSGCALNYWENLTKAETGRFFDDFGSIPPSKALQWHSCFDENLRCAKLQVAMDYNHSASPAVELALIMLPGRNHAKSNEYSPSPLILNPGGPGASGVEFVRSLGRSFQQIVGDDWDIVSFDPRGVGYTRPSADCFTFPSSERSVSPEESDVLHGQFNRLQFAVANEAVGLVNSSASALAQRNDAARAMAKLCKSKDDLQGDSSILRYLDSQSVARDMLSIVDAWDSWLSRLSTTRANNEASFSDIKGKLVYWGFSYGSVLGCTFAAMFPDRIGRMVLDGVVDVEESTTLFPTGALQDADTIYQSFFEYCARAGPTKCALARDGDDTRAVADRAAVALQNLRKHSLVGVHPPTHTPSIVTWSMIQTVTFGALYKPVTSFPFIAQVYDLLHRQEYETLLANIPQLHAQLDVETYCRSQPSTTFSLGDAQTAIQCSARQHFNASVAELERLFKQLSQESSFADVYMNAGLPCNGWSIETAKSPLLWPVSTSRNQVHPFKTSFPLLFISNSFDPITPLRSGLKMAKRFAEAGLLEQRGEGHCSVNQVSLCTMSKIRAYFRQGKVPPAPRLRDGADLRDGNWEKCQTDEWPWNPFGRQEEDEIAGAIPRSLTIEEGREHGLSHQEVVARTRAWQKIGDSILAKTSQGHSNSYAVASGYGRQNRDT